jgi:uncharacterized protein YbgA (DUF1722 family)
LRSKSQFESASHRVCSARRFASTAAISARSGDRAEVTELIDRYRRALVPLIAPITLIRHYVRKYSHPYLSEQVNLDPHPPELMLLNQI